MFGSMHRIRRNRRNRTEVTITYPYRPSQAEIYYEMYLAERNRRVKYQNRIIQAREIVTRSTTIPEGVKKALKVYLKP